MKLQTKVFLMLIFIIFFKSYIVYNSYLTQKEAYNKFISYSLSHTIEKIKLDIKKADKINKIFIPEKTILETIHKSVLTKLQDQKKINLKKLKKELDQKTLPKGTFTHIYLIDSNYIIYDTTYIKDLNLDMKNFLSAKEYLDSAIKDQNKIFIANPSLDILTGKYRIYSYSVLDKERKTFLEIGFFDTSIGKIKNIIYNFNLKNSMIKDIELFENYGKYIINLSKHKNIKNISKQEYITKIINTKNRETEIIRKVTSTKETFFYDIDEKDKKYRICYNYVNSEKTATTTIRDYILKTKIDITFFEEKLFDLKILFYKTLFLSITIAIIFFIFLKISILVPLKKILLKIDSKEIIKDINLLNKKDEFGKLSNYFNNISTKLKFSRYEVYSTKGELKKANAKLLKFNKNLEKRVEIEVEKNRQKDKQMMQQSRLAQMGETVNLIAHQWRQPLGAINSAIISAQIRVQSAKYNFERKKDREDFLKFIDEKHKNINEYVQFLSTTIDDFRNFFKPEKEKELVKINSLIDKVLQIAIITINDKNIKINIDYQNNDKIFIYKNRTMQVILNILQNSEDNFLEKNTKNPQINIVAKKENNECIIQISDNGGGIPDDILPKIFEPYFSTKLKKNGTGLGLYMSKIIIEEHNNGKLDALNIDNGVCFEIALKS